METIQSIPVDIAQKWIENWRTVGEIHSENKVSFFVFEREKLLSILDRRNENKEEITDGIRFYIAKETDVVNDKNGIHLIAVGVKKNGDNYEDIWDENYIIKSLHSETSRNYPQKSKFDKKFKFDIISPDPLLVRVATKWIHAYQYTTPMNGNSASDKSKLRAVLYENDIKLPGDNISLLRKYLSLNFDYLLIHIATIVNVDGYTLPDKNKLFLETFILSVSGSDIPSEDGTIVPLPNTGTSLEPESNSNSVLEFGTACPPNCGGTCC